MYLLVKKELKNVYYIEVGTLGGQTVLSWHTQDAADSLYATVQTRL